MTTYLAEDAQFQPMRQVAKPAVFSWLGLLLAARRQRCITKMHIRHLRMLDGPALNDIGVDVARLHNIRPSIMEANPVSVCFGPFRS